MTTKVVVIALAAVLALGVGAKVASAKGTRATGVAGPPPPLPPGAPPPPPKSIVQAVAEAVGLPGAKYIDKADATLGKKIRTGSRGTSDWVNRHTFDHLYNCENPYTHEVYQRNVPCPPNEGWNAGGSRTATQDSTGRTTVRTPTNPWTTRRI